MNATPEHFDEADRPAHGAGGAGAMGAGSEMSRFFSDVEDLLKRVTHMNDADAARLRERVESSLAGARGTVARSASRVRESAGEMARASSAPPSSATSSPMGSSRAQRRSPRAGTPRGAGGWRWRARCIRTGNFRLPVRGVRGDARLDAPAGTARRVAEGQGLAVVA